MAVPSLGATAPGATAPDLPIPAPHFAPAGAAFGATAPRRDVLQVQGQSRTRRCHGAFQLGDDLAAVYSSRRLSDGAAVTLTVSDGLAMLAGRMTVQQARLIARALLAAGEAAEGLQRQPQIERHASRANATRPEGGAA